MKNRKDRLLQLIIENYLTIAEPVGSRFLIESAGLEVSGATVRNEMSDLEEAGYLTHPYTSAGRIPTELGYKHYVNNIMKEGVLNNKVKNGISEIYKNGGENRIKNIAKQVAEYVNNSVIVALNKDSIYYTGISYLFSQPEFRNYTHAVSVSTIFDECEQRIESLYELVDNEIKILLGNENPLGNACGIVVGKIGESGLFAILGPLRMDYAKSVGVLKYISGVIRPDVKSG